MKSRPFIRISISAFVFILLSISSLSGNRLFAGDLTPPMSRLVTAMNLDVVDNILLPTVDEEMYRQQDADREAEGPGGPKRFAAPHFVEFTLENSGTWEDLPTGDRLWRLRLTSRGARSLNLGFTTFRLPADATLHAYAPESNSFVGPYRAEDATEGELWTPIIERDEAVIELFVPEHAAFEPELVIGQANHDYVGFGTTAREKVSQGWCNNDVVCSVGRPWADEIKTEGVYTLSGLWACSGQMMNTVGSIKPPYFLTAYHCGITSSNDQTVVIYWNYQASVCGALSGGSFADNQTGSILRARYSTSDFCLVELSADPDPDHNVFYSGWDATGGVASTSVAIHHPSTDEKAISFNTDPLAITSYLSYSSPGNSTHLKVDNWEDGTTEGGSSGSGIWDQDHHLVGQLHGGYASCSSITSDWYGRLSRSWSGGGSSSNRLMDWLDPDRTSTLIIDTVDPNNASTEVADNRPLQTRSSSLMPIAPNPAPGASQIQFNLPKPGVVELEVYNASGRLVSNVDVGGVKAGASAISWDGLSDTGSELSAGVYFIRLKVDDEHAGTEKVVLIR